MNLKKWESHHWGAAVFIFIGLMAVSFYWGQNTIVSAAPKVPTYPVGTRVEVTSSLNVYDKANTKAGALQCVQQVGAQGTVTDGPRNAQGLSWIQVDFDTYCDGWVSVETPLTII